MATEIAGPLLLDPLELLVPDPEQLGEFTFVAVTTLPERLKVKGWPKTVPDAVVAELVVRVKEKDVDVDPPHCPATGLWTEILVPVPN